MAEQTEGVKIDKVQEINIEGMGAKFNSKNVDIDTLLSILAVFLLGVMAVMLYDQRTALTKAAEVAAAATTGEHKVLHGAIDRQTEAIVKSQQSQDETTYILTLTQAERERLRVRMPNSLRSKVNGDRN